MSAPKMQQIPTELERVIRRLQDAARDLASAADSADDAIADIQSALDPESPKEVASVIALAEMVVRMHDDEHEGPRRWCTREACKAAEAALEVEA